MAKLKHTFDDDGIFWISFDDMLANFDTLDRTRLFNREWTVVQKWTSVNVSWVTGYLKAKFRVRITEAGPVVIVLSQLDTRYYRGLEGQYTFELYFVLRDAHLTATATGVEEIVRARGAVRGSARSVSAEVRLEPGEYDVLPKILAQRDPNRPLVEDVVREYAGRNPQKLRQIGLHHDLANAKGLTLEELSTPDEDRGKMNNTETELKKKPGHGTTIGESTATDTTDKADEDIEPTTEDTKLTQGVTSAKGTPSDKHKQEAAKKEEEHKASTSHQAVDDPGATPGAEPEIDEKKKDEGKHKMEEKKDDETCSKKADQKMDDEDDEDDGVDMPWNAVCVIGLRVYSKNAGAAIDIVTPKDSEGASLQIDTKTWAGATT
jgi:hypothetical protein